MRRMLVIVNPHATGAPRELRDTVAGILERGYHVRVLETEAQRHAVELARDGAREGFDVVAAFGGDGTVNEVANGLAESPNAALACLPAGQANVFAKMLGAPTHAVAASERLVALAAKESARRIDLGVVNGRCFTFSSGLGVDASVTDRVDRNPRLKARLGPWYYAWVAMSTAHHYRARPPHMALRIDGGSSETTLRGVTAVIQNGSTYTFFKRHPIEIADGGGLDSGSLAGCVLRRLSLADVPSLAFRALYPRARVSSHPQVESFAHASELTVRSADGRAVSLHVDGDYLGDVTEARYSIRPRALAVLA